MELVVRNAGMFHETVDDFKEMEKILCPVLIACTMVKAKNYVCNTEISGFKEQMQTGQLHFSE